MDTAPYHSVLLENIPKSNTKKSDVQKWVSEKGIDFSPIGIGVAVKRVNSIVVCSEAKLRVGNGFINFG